jgi:hypothetical protein
VVSKSRAHFFECSPLSCNHAAKTFKANAHCLFDALDEAVAAARVFSKGSWEPGPVLRCPGLAAAAYGSQMTFVGANDA